MRIVVAAGLDDVYLSRKLKESSFPCKHNPIEKILRRVFSLLFYLLFSKQNAPSNLNKLLCT